MTDPTTLTTSPVTSGDVHARSATPTPPSTSHASGERVRRSRAVRWLVSARRGSRVLGGMVPRRRSVDSVVVGCLLTLLAISFDVAGWLTPIEFLLYDARAAAFQLFLPRPSDKLVHLDINDGALETVGRWPWPRSVMAEVIDELAVAKPKVVGLDILFGEAQEPDWRPVPAATTQPVGGATRQPADAAGGGGGETYVGEVRRTDHDKLLGEALQRLGCALVPVSLPFERRARPSDLHVAIRVELSRDLNQPQTALVDRLRARGFGAPDLPEQVSREYLSAWREEMSAAIRRAVRAAPVPRELVKRNLLKLDKTDVVLEGAFDKLYTEALSAARVVRFSRAIPPNIPALFPADLRQLPVPPIAGAAAYSANIEYAPFRDGRVRAVPLFVKNDDRMYPQMGLAMACAQLGVDLSQLRFTADTVIIPAPDGREIVIPHRAYRSTAIGEEIATFIDIPWWGGDAWPYMYDHPDHRVPVNHLSLVAVWDLVLTRRRVEQNASSADAAIIAVLALTDTAAAERYAARPPAPHDVAARAAAYASARAAGKDTADLVHDSKPEDLDELSKRFVASYDALPKLMDELKALDQRLRDGRNELAQLIGGKSVFVGWTASSSAADFVPTSIHAKCPGVVVHGAIFNGILTGELWRTLPGWVTYLVTGVLGVCMTVAVAFLTPTRALIVAACLIVGYALFNGVLMFDYGNLILGSAGPLICVAAVWQGCTLIRLVVERYQRSRIEGRFRSYVDPALVDYVVEHPDQIKLEGQVREMTVCFTDLGNFTPLTARLKEATVPLLNRIFGAMVPEIRKNNGYVNKFLGDGLMFFFGAPRQNAGHAGDALRTILAIQDAMREINAELTERGLPTITLRAGVNTGQMVVGDAGSEQASDYTVLGDNVNLAARLESANKQLGTGMLVSARTAELAGEDGVLLRPVGQICVVGREEPVLAHEVLCRASEASDAQRRLADLTRYMVDAFRDRRLPDCLRAAADLDREFGPSKLTALYRDRCQFFRNNPSEAFDCTLTLSEK